MNPTLFVEYMQKWFGAIAKRFVERVNGSKAAPKYLFKTMLTPELSADLKWDALSVDSSIVAADVVSMDSPLPLKKRDVMRSAAGDIPKLGMKMDKSEKLISDIQILKAKGATEAEIAKKIFEDTPKVISGVYERLEHMFLQGLSTGAILVPDSENVGAGIRVDFGYSDNNKRGVAVKWGETGYTPVTDIENALSVASANGDVITTIAIDKASYNLLRKSDEAKALYAGSIGVSGQNIPVPNPTQFDSIMEDEYQIKFIVIDRAVRYEKNGIQTPVRPFAENTLVFLTTEQVGRLVYGTLAEEDHPVGGVEYQKVDSYILVSKYSKNDPLREFTSSQALVLPVIENVDSIYLMDTQTVQG